MLVFSLIISSAIILFGCVSKESDSENFNSPSLFYKKALFDLDKGNYSEALKKFSMITQDYPYTEWARQSFLKEISIHYHEKEYLEALNLARKYIVFYPKSDDVAYAYYILARSYFDQIEDIRHDEEPARAAISAMQEILDHYPKSEYVTDAKAIIHSAREKLAAKEMDIGRYYLNGLQYIAAVKRFSCVVKRYSDTTQIEEALYRLVEANYAMGLISEAEESANVLKHNYKGSSWSVDAWKLLKRN
ncbi:MAG: outer membrane protein assembly factor BamD [Candidatus Tokpelaia sp. JSC161]|nr:MAG: outer membrane protein assembly factor BamD [Candidatus Tokpelaia sp. JSC161]